MNDDAPKKIKQPPLAAEGIVNVINDLAIYLPQPEWTPQAQAAGERGLVNISVAIDANGNVVAARIVSGFPMLAEAALAVARLARFRAIQTVDGPVMPNVGILEYMIPSQ